MQFNKTSILEFMGGVVSAILFYLRGRDNKQLVADHANLSLTLNYIASDIKDIEFKINTITTMLDENTKAVERLSREFGGMDRDKVIPKEYRE